MLENAATQQNICADGTYKIMYQGFPLIVAGFVDRYKHFHVIGICATSNERQRDYEFIFEALKKGIYKHTQIAFEPKILMSDAAPAIRNAFYATFESAEQNVICFVHVLRNIQRAKFKSKVNKESIISEVMILLQCSSMAEFDNACRLFIKKWEQSEPDFCA